MLMTIAIPYWMKAIPVPNQVPAQSTSQVQVVAQVHQAAAQVQVAAQAHQHQK